MRCSLAKLSANPRYLMHPYVLSVGRAEWVPGTGRNIFSAQKKYSQSGCIFVRLSTAMMNNSLCMFCIIKYAFYPRAWKRGAKITALPNPACATACRLISNVVFLMLTFNVDVFHWYVITAYTFTGFAVSTALAGCREMQQACKNTAQ